MQTGSAHAKAPWSPTGIALISLIFSPLPGGILHALNYPRLGRPELKRPALAANLFSAAVLAFLWVFASEISLGVRLLITAFVASYFYKSQAPLFDQRLSDGSRKASLVLPTILALSTLVPWMILGLVASYAEETRYQAAFNHAVTLLETGRHREAEPYLQAYQAEYPYDMESYWNLALVYERSGEIEKAKRELRDFLRRNPPAQEALEVTEYLERLEAGDR